MSKKRKVNNIYEGLSPRQIRALLCLVECKTISETSRRLKISRGAIYNWLGRSEFLQAMFETMINSTILEEVSDQSLKYREEILRAVIRIFCPADSRSDVLLDRFRRSLDTIDRKLGLDGPPFFVGCEDLDEER